MPLVANSFTGGRGFGPQCFEHRPDRRARQEPIDDGLVVTVDPGGDELAGFYTDSHCGLTPPDVWEWAYEFGPRFKNLRAIVFEFHESYFGKLGLQGIAGELERMHLLADSLATKAPQNRVA